MKVVTLKTNELVFRGTPADCHKFLNQKYPSYTKSETAVGGREYSNQKVLPVPMRLEYEMGEYEDSYERTSHLRVGF